MRIGLDTREDLPALMEIMRRVVPLMRAAGNLQRDETYPNETVFQRHIDLGLAGDAPCANRITSLRWPEQRRK